MPVAVVFIVDSVAFDLKAINLVLWSSALHVDSRILGTDEAEYNSNHIFAFKFFEPLSLADFCSLITKFS